MNIVFYRSTLEKLLAQKLISPEMKVLVVCGGRRDQEAFQALGFTNVTISNLDIRVKGDEFAPYQWSFQDAENLTYAEGKFDLVVVYAGLHHCHSPHRAFLEMYRVARVGALVFESRDSFLIKMATRMGFNADFEVEAVIGNDYRYGGVSNSQIPNFVYRWTEREVRKMVWSYAPQHETRFHFFYGLRVPYGRLARLKFAAVMIARVFEPGIRLITRLFPKLSNQFAFFVEKPGPLEKLQPWLTTQDGEIVIDREWTKRRFR